MDNELTDEEIAAHFSAMDDSVNLINDTIADDTEALRIYQTEEEVNLMVTRNTDHLEIQAKKDWYKDSLNNKTSYNDAVTAGKTYVAA